MVDLAYGAANGSLTESVMTGRMSFTEPLRDAKKGSMLPLTERGKTRLSPNRPGNPSEQGARHADPTSEVFAFYYKGEEVEPDARVLARAEGFPGEESIEWGVESHYGPYKNIVTTATAFDRDRELEFTLLERELATNPKQGLQQHDCWVL